MGQYDTHSLIDLYRRGVFPMADTRDDPNIVVVEPDMRGMIDFGAFHVPRRLARTVRADLYEVTVDTDFPGTIDACAAPGPDRPVTWINAEIESLYSELHRNGQAHSVECRKDGVLVGGLYGVSLGGAFFGESMFSTARDASKVALVHLVARLIVGGYDLLDCQFMTEHLAQFGTLEMPQADYMQRLAGALTRHGDFAAIGERVSGYAALQAINQAS